MKSKKVIPILSLGIGSIVTLGILVAEVRADSTVFAHSVTIAQGTSETPTTDTTTTSASASPSHSAKATREEQKMAAERKKNRRIYDLGICVGQTLAKQGYYLSEVTPSSSPGNPDDVNVTNTVTAARQSCEQEAQGQTPTPSPSVGESPTPASSPSPTSGASSVSPTPTPKSLNSASE